MKKQTLKFISYFLLILIFAFSFACDNAVYLHLNLNDSSADYTQAYREEKGNFESNNLTMVVAQRKIPDLPTYDDLVAPSGKVFAGWYFDSEGSVDKIVNEPVWDATWSSKTGATIYAKWINNDEVLFVFNLGDSSADFTTTFKENNGNFLGRTYQKVVKISALESAILEFPTVTDIVAPELKVFAGWYLDANCSTPLTAENFIANKVLNKGDMALYAKYDDIPVVTLCYVFDKVTVKAETNEKYDNVTYTALIKTVLDTSANYDNALLYLPTTDDFNYEPCIFGGWFMDENFTIEFNKENFESMLESERVEGISNVHVYIYSMWTYPTD